MIDIHSHILPGVDDGANSLEDSLSMAKQAIAEGIHSIMATPHHQNGKFNNYKDHIIQQVNELNRQFQHHNINLTVLPGQESRIHGELINGYVNGEILTLNGNGKYLFVEFPSNQIPRYSKQLFFDIQSQGLTPIIVHPERNSKIIENPDLLYEFVTQGALTQVTAGSITGRFGKKIKKFSSDLIKFNLTHVIASDAHNVSGRGFYMAEAHEIIEDKFGLDLIYTFQDNAHAIINGENCFKEIPEKVTKKKFLGVF